MLVVISGDTRTGKTTLGNELAETLGWPHIQSSCPLRRLFGLTQAEWEQAKELPAFGLPNATLRDVAITIADAIASAVSPDGYARLLLTYIRSDNTVISGIRKPVEEEYFWTLGATIIRLSSRPDPFFSGGILEFPQTYDKKLVEDVAKWIKSDHSNFVVGQDKQTLQSSGKRREQKKS